MVGPGCSHSQYSLPRYTDVYRGFLCELANTTVEQPVRSGAISGRSRGEERLSCWCASNHATIEPAPRISTVFLFTIATLVRHIHGAFLHITFQSVSTIFTTESTKLVAIVIAIHVADNALVEEDRAGFDTRNGIHED